MAGKDIWVFGYGSLMWRPGFRFAESRPALLRGYHRALCVHSRRYRGTEDCPGLVVGLDRGGSCRGRAMRVRGDDAERVLAYLWKREMGGVYAAKTLRVVTPEGPVRALCFVCDRGHANYAGNLDAATTVAWIKRGRGIRGTALEYLENTVAHLDDLGIREGRLHDILQRAKSPHPPTLRAGPSRSAGEGRGEGSGKDRRRTNRSMVAARMRRAT